MAAPAGSELLLIGPEGENHSHKSVLVTEKLLRARSIKLTEKIDSQLPQHTAQADIPEQQLVLLKLPLLESPLEMYAELLCRGRAWLSETDCVISYYENALQIYSFALQWDDIGAADAAVNMIQEQLEDNPSCLGNPIMEALAVFEQGSLARDMLADTLTMAGPLGYIHSLPDCDNWLTKVGDLNFTIRVCKVLGRALDVAQFHFQDDLEMDVEESCKYHLHVALGLPCYKETLKE